MLNAQSTSTELVRDSDMRRKPSMGALIAPLPKLEGYLSKASEQHYKNLVHISGIEVWYCDTADFMIGRAEVSRSRSCNVFIIKTTSLPRRKTLTTQSTVGLGQLQSFSMCRRRPLRVDEHNREISNSRVVSV